MSRADWKVGRFDVNYETNEVYFGLRGHRNAQIGDVVQYYRFNISNTGINDVYDEGYGIGKQYTGPIPLPCLHVVHEDGSNENLDTGFYYNDSIYVTAAFDQMYRTGLRFQDLEHQDYLKDRMVYDNKVFRVTAIHVVGQIQERDMIVSMEGTQVQTDELVNDIQFKQWSA